MTIRAATCACGKLRLACEGEPMRVSICHCQACQRRTGSVFGVAARYLREKVTIEGEASEYVRIGDEGNEIRFRFCPHCGSTVCWEMPAFNDGIAVAIGAFADPGYTPVPSRSIYDASRRHAWVEITVPVERRG
ncbi:MAG: GFA family protein [Alphaproteobacteria bacterium]|nr:GFA family protein [Alphaproteobacteria bacterium]